MIFENADIEFLKLCGLCRYVPTGLQKRYDALEFKSSVISNLQVRGFIKKQSDNSSYKLTGIGRDFLADIGYTFPYDARMSIKKNSYQRKLISAEVNVILYLAGIDVYYKYPYELAGKETGYASALIMRTDKNMKVLAGTRFLGVLKIADTAYITYHIENKDAWIIPGYEQGIFVSQVESIKNIKSIKLILLGKSSEELWECIHQNNKPDKAPGGRKRFDVALEEIGYNYLLVPFGRNGVLQMGILKNRRYRERIAQAIGCTSVINERLSECDGMLGDIPCVIAVDFEVERIVRALKQIFIYDKNIIPKICCLPFQKPVMFKLLKRYGCQKSVVISVDKDSIYNIFPDIKYNMTHKPYITKEGECVEVTSRNKKISDEEWENI